MNSMAYIPYQNWDPVKNALCMLVLVKQNCCNLCHGIDIYVQVGKPFTRTMVLGTERSDAPYPMASERLYNALNPLDMHKGGGGGG